jgi:hypothetical protein
MPVYFLLINQTRKHGQEVPGVSKAGLDGCLIRFISQERGTSMPTLQGSEIWHTVLRARIKPVKLVLMIAAIVLSAVVVPLVGNTGTAHAATITCPSTIQYGSTGSLVKQLQTALDYDALVALAIDGDFGSATQAGVITFQKDAFPNDSSQWNGQVGPHTWGALGYCHSSGGISGGGCTSGALFSACIAVGSGKVIPDTYASSGFNIVYIYLIEDGNGPQAHIKSIDTGQGAAQGGHFTGYSPTISSGHSWVTMVQGLKGSTWYETVSPPQYT